MSSKRHVYTTGAAGCGGKAAPLNAKNAGQPLPCPFCDRIFKQDGRLKEHLKNKHPDEEAASSSSSAPPEVEQQQSTYPVKTPKTLLHEWCQKNKRPAPKFMHVENAGGFHCRVILPDGKKSELDVILWSRDATPNSQEAQHRAAVLGLHHVMGNRRLDRILPEEYRQQWHDLDAAVAEREAKLKLKLDKPKKPAFRPKELQSVFMSEGNRRLIEEVLTDRNSAASEVQPSDNHAKMLSSLLEMGFKPGHVQASLEQASDIPGALDWLMLNVKESDLPAKFAPQASKAAVRVFQRAVEYEAFEDDGAAQLVEYGYDYERCEAALLETGSVENALSKLFYDSVQQKHPCTAALSEDLAAMREEEQVAMRSIYPGAVVSESIMVFDFDVDLFSTGAQKLTMEVRVPSSCSYPFELPVIGFRGKNMKPAYLLSVTKKVTRRGLELLGMPMIYELVCYAGEVCNTPVEEAAAANVPKQVEVFAIPAEIKRNSKSKKSSDSRSLAAESILLKEQWDNLQNSNQYADAFAARRKLPAYKRRGEILTGINKSRVTIICGETGCGKSTQVPQYVLEESIEMCKGALCNIICTQPRRIAALGLASRVAKERNEPVGKMVGYSVRLDSCCSKHTKLLYCTTGILLRRLLSDPELEGVTHIFVDEVHERSLENDLLLLLLRNHLQRTKSLIRVILMSATADANMFARYFQQDCSPSVLYIPGFTFPVREHYLEDVLQLTGYKVNRNSRYAMKKKPAETVQASVNDTDSWGTGVVEDWEADTTISYSETTKRSLALVDESIINFELIETLLFTIFALEREDSTALRPLTAPQDWTKAGSILVFLPGMMEIRMLQSRLQNSKGLAEYGVETRWVLALHGSLSGDEQRRVFLRPPNGVRKLVLATNVAETSITIDDILYVIDTGRHKENSYDPSKGLACLQEAWVSKASSKQRSGRAGRVQPGCCFRLYSRRQFQKFEDHQLPEVQRVSLEGLCLKVKSLLHMKVETALSQLPTPPDAQAVVAALELLNSIGALETETEDLTPLGKHLSQMPVDARIGKMLVFGCMFKCLDPVLTIAASMSGRPVFVSPQDSREEARLAKLKLSGSSKSDHLAVVAAYNGWIAAKKDGWNAEKDYCNSNFLSRDALVGIEASRDDYVNVLRDLGFISAGHQEGLDTNSNSVRVIKAVVCAGFYPNVARIRHPEKTYVQTEGGTVPKLAAAHEIHYFTKSDGRVFLHPASVNFSVGHFESSWLVLTDKVKTSKVYVRECSMVSAYSLLIFGGSISVQHEKQIIVVDGWLEFEAPARIAVLIKELRREVDMLLLEKIDSPGLNISCRPIVSALLKLLETDGF